MLVKFQFFVALFLKHLVYCFYFSRALVYFKEWARGFPLVRNCELVRRWGLFLRCQESQTESLFFISCCLFQFPLKFLHQSFFGCRTGYFLGLSLSILFPLSAYKIANILIQLDHIFVKRFHNQLIFCIVINWAIDRLIKFYNFILLFSLEWLWCTPFKNSKMLPYDF